MSLSTDRNRSYAGLYRSLHDEGSPALPGNEQALIDQKLGDVLTEASARLQQQL